MFDRVHFGAIDVRVSHPDMRALLADWRMAAPAGGGVPDAVDIVPASIARYGDDLALLVAPTGGDLRPRHVGQRAARDVPRTWGPSHREPSPREPSPREPSPREPSHRGSGLGHNGETAGFLDQLYRESLAVELPIHVVSRSVDAEAVHTWERLILPVRSEPKEPTDLIVHMRPIFLWTELLNVLVTDSASGVMFVMPLRGIRGEVRDFDIQFANPAASDMFAIPANDSVEAVAFGALLDLVSAGRLRQEMALVLAAAAPRRVHAAITVAGTTRELEMAITPSGAGLVVTVTDITQRKQTLRTIEAQAGELHNAYGALAAAHERLSVLHKRVEDELQAAQQLQMHLLPSRQRVAAIEAGYGAAISSLFRPSSHLGGDHWTFSPLTEDCFALCVYDFSGHGVDAALYVFRLNAVHAATAMSEADPGAYLARINDFLVEQLPTGRYATAVVAVVDVARGEIRYAAAGAPDPVVVLADEAGVLRGSGRGLPLGIQAGRTYPTRSLKLPPGAMFALFSDGLVEGLDPLDRAQGQGVFEEVLAAAAAWEEPAGAVTSLLGERLGWSPEDDLTLVCVRRREA